MHVLPVYVLLLKIQMPSRSVCHVLDLVLFCCVSLKLQYLTVATRILERLMSAVAGM